MVDFFCFFLLFALVLFLSFRKQHFTVRENIKRIYGSDDANFIRYPGRSSSVFQTILSIFSAVLVLFMFCFFCWWLIFPLDAVIENNIDKLMPIFSTIFFFVSFLETIILYKENEDFQRIIKKLLLFFLIYFLPSILICFFSYCYYKENILDMGIFLFFVFSFFLCLAVNISICVSAFLGIVFIYGIWYFFIVFYSLLTGKRINAIKCLAFSHRFFHNFWMVCFWMMTFYYVYWFFGKLLGVFQSGKGNFGGGGASGRWK